jgi:DNA-binding transcriptional regulator YhcF (GntR family)
VKVRLPDSLRAAKDEKLLVDAVYYAVRVLRNSRRGYTRTVVSTEPLPQVRQLAELVIQEIETTEKRRLSGLTDRRIIEYITALEAFLRARSSAKSDKFASDAEEILKEMRAKGLG